MANIAMGLPKANRKYLNALVVSVIYFCPEKSAENRKESYEDTKFGKWVID